jgi:hypothetical protein
MRVFLSIIFMSISTSALIVANDTAKIKNFNLEQFLNATDWTLRAHKKQLDELEKQGKLNISPSQAQLFYPDPVKNRENIQERLREYSYRTQGRPIIDPRWYGGAVAPTILDLGQRQALNKAMAKDQKIHKKGGVAVYHSTNPYAYGQSYIRTKEQDLILELQGTPVLPSKWLAFRDIDQHQDRSREKAIRKDYLAIGTVNDEIPRNSEYLMACSVGLPATGEKESSLYFWLQNTNMQRRVFPPMQFSGQYGSTLDSVADELNKEVSALRRSTGTGILLQVAFKDKNKLDKLMYSSAGFGLKNRYHVGEKESKRILEKPKEVIETMMHKPSEFRTDDLQSNAPQTRIVLTGDQLLDPTNPKIRKNVEVNAYTDNQEALDAFHTKVDAVFERVKERAKEDYKARYSAMNLPQKFWHTLQLKLCRPMSYADRKSIKKDIRERGPLLHSE